MTFEGQKYIDASAAALDFIKRQMNVSNFLYTPSFAEQYADDYTANIIWGTVAGLPGGDEKVFPQHINVNEYYPPDYTDYVAGTWFGLSDVQYEYVGEGDGQTLGRSTNYFVDVYVLTDGEYLFCSCPLREDGTWRSEMFVTVTESYPEIDEETGEPTGGTVTVTYSYWETVPVTEGFKEFRLTLPDGTIDYPYSRFVNFKARLYSYTDAEYLSGEVPIWDMGGGNYVFYRQNAAYGKKIVKIVQRTWNPDLQDHVYVVQGIGGAKTGIAQGRLPASFLIPSDDPQYDKEGNSALGVYGYMLNSRCWAYDVGLALLTFTTSGDYDLCQEMLNRMAAEQGADGSFNFSYDIYIGQLFEGYIRTGAIGWAVWGMAYYMLTTNDRAHLDMVTRAADWLLGQQVQNREDLRYGLLKGGYGLYNMNDYSYDPTTIEWCSIEHQCSALQALHGAALLTGERRYAEAADLIKERLILAAYDRDNKRFYQGVSKDGADTAWALDCTTWAGRSALSILARLVPSDCRQTAYGEYLVQGASILQSAEDEHFNQTYSLNGTTEGFKPYSNRGGGYNGAPEIVWTEGTLGYCVLCLALGETAEAQRFVDATIELQNCNGSTGGVVYTTATYASLPWEFHVWESVVSSAWLYLAINNPDVLFPIVMKRETFRHKMTAELPQEV